MKSGLTHTKWSGARLAIAGGLLILLLAAALPPLLAPGWRVPLMHALSSFCHQIPERSFTHAGVPLGLCHRCTGIVAGLLVGLLAPWTGLRRWHPLAILAVALAPLAVDWSLDFAGLLANTVASRVGTGIWGGAVLAGLILGAMRTGTARTAPDQPAVVGK